MVKKMEKCSRITCGSGSTSKIERIYLRQMSSDGSVNKTILKPRLALAARRQYVYVGFSRRKIPRSSAARWQPIGKAAKFRIAYKISEKAIRLRHTNYEPDRAQKLISSSMSLHLSTRNISSKSMHAFLSNLANRQIDRQTNKQTRAKTCTSFFGGNK